MPFYIVEDGSIQEVDNLTSAAMLAGQDVGMSYKMGPFNTEDDALEFKYPDTINVDVNAAPMHPLEHPISITLIAVILAIAFVKIGRKVI